MATLEEKISALTGLLGQGILTTEEFSQILKVINSNNAEAEKVVTPIERYYNDCFKNKIVNVYKSPSTCKWPPLEPSMVREGVVSILNGMKFENRNVRYIETYIDATNSYGAYLRQKLRIVIDGEGKPVQVIKPAGGDTVTVTGGILEALGKKVMKGGADSWEPMVGIKLP